MRKQREGGVLSYVDACLARVVTFVRVQQPLVTCLQCVSARNSSVLTAWAIGGHSHGASSLGAVAIANETEVRGLAMLGSVPMNLGRVIDLSARRDIEVLNVLATEDNITSPKRGAVLKYGGGLVEDMFKMLPKSTRRVVIKGGNHAGFGDYGIQAYDGERTISLEDQQDQVARHLVAFLKRVQKRGGRR